MKYTLSPDCWFPLLTMGWLWPVCLLMTSPGVAQVIPDNTLGAENSVVTPLDAQRDRIDGGALRGETLFHSFEQFSILENRGVYFANPEVVNTIFSRVTGEDPSNLFGTLGVLGNADLVFLNPNGIIFGPNAQLDLQGGLTATTANAVTLPGGERFSATNPIVPPLITVNIAAPSGLIFEGAESGDITSSATLAVAGEFDLSAQNLNLEGQLVAGENLTLKAQEQVTIRDAVTQPFIAAAGGDLTIQGNEQVDIVALSHPDSGLYAYGDLVLRAPQAVGGDAHFWSAGDFRVETLEGDIGDLYSPIAPIIRAFGDVEIGFYAGSSLHILAGGEVSIGQAFIAAPDSGSVGIDFLQETIQLSDGTFVNIDGQAQTTLDVRAGVSPESIGTPPLNERTGFSLSDLLLGENITTTPTSSDITIGDAIFFAPEGLVLLTNQYQPNLQVSGGDIRVQTASPNGGIITSTGEVFLDARNNISVVDSSVNTAGIGEVGNIKLIAGNTIEIDNSTVQSPNVGIGNGGDIEIIANQIFVANDTAIGTGRNNTVGNTGNIILTAADSIVFNGDSDNPGFQTGAFANLQEGASGQSGDIIITTGSLSILNGATLVSATEGEGDAGDILITAEETVVFDGPLVDPASAGVSSAFVRVQSNAIGDGGDLVINAAALTLTDSAQLIADTLGEGNAGNVIVNVTGDVTLESGGIFTNVTPAATGNGGDIIITSEYFTASNFSQLRADTQGAGNSGSVVISVSGDVAFQSSRALTSVTSNATGMGGDIEINATSFSIDGEEISATSNGEGNPGDVTINANQVNLAGDARILAETTASAPGGVVTLRPFEDGSSLAIAFADNSTISASTSGDGIGGSLRLLAPESSISISGLGRLEVETSDTSPNAGLAGNIEVTTPTFTLSDEAVLSASTEGAGQAGDINLFLSDRLFIDNASIESSTTEGSTGDGGSIFIDPQAVEIRNQGRVAVNSEGEGVGGNITVISDTLSLLDASSIVAETVSTDGGNITLDLGNLLLMRNGSLISTTAGTAEAGGNGGIITIAMPDGLILGVPQENSDIAADAFEGDGGRVDITARAILGLEFRDRRTSLSDITASSEGGGRPGVVDITTLDVDPTQGLDAPPEEPRSTEIAEGCAVAGTAETASYFDYGRGGKLPAPEDLMFGNAIIAEWTPLELADADDALTAETLRSVPPVDLEPYVMVSCGATD
jgi:filamentous hemagglutinin family protein